MGIINELKSDVASRNIANIRIDLWGCIGGDPSCSQDFVENWNYCIENGITESELYEIHDNRPISGEITDENFALLCGQLRSNFSKERLEKIKEIGRKLYPVEEKPKSQTSTQTSGTHRTTASSAKTDSADSGLLIAVGAGVLLGAIGGGILGGLLLKKAVLGAVAGAAIGAGVGAGMGKASSNK